MMIIDVIFFLSYKFWCSAHTCLRCIYVCMYVRLINNPNCLTNFSFFFSVRTSCVWTWVGGSEGPTSFVINRAIDRS